MADEDYEMDGGFVDFSNFLNSFPTVNEPNTFSLTKLGFYLVNKKKFNNRKKLIFRYEDEPPEPELDVSFVLVNFFSALTYTTNIADDFGFIT